MNDVLRQKAERTRIYDALVAPANQHFKGVREPELRARLVQVFVLTRRVLGEHPPEVGESEASRAAYYLRELEKVPDIVNGKNTAKSKLPIVNVPPRLSDDLIDLVRIHLHAIETIAVEAIQAASMTTDPWVRRGQLRKALTDIKSRAAG